MIAKRLFFSVILLLSPGLLSSNLHAQPARKKAPAQKQVSKAQPAEDGLAQHLKAAEAAQLSGDLERAAVENRAIAAIVLQRLGTIALEEERYPEAVTLLNDSVRFGDDAQTRINLAMAYLRSSELDRAITEARAAARLDPQAVRVRYLLGKLAYLKGDYAAAQPELEHVLKTEPDFDAAYTLGLTYLQLKQLPRAQALFEQIRAVIKKNAELHLFFGRAYEDADYPAEAEREFRAALSIDPKVPRAHFYLGYLLLQHGGGEKLSEAGREFEKELQMSPQDFPSNFFAGVVATSMNEHARAVRYLQEAIRLNPEIGLTYLYLGQSQIELGDAAAEQSLRRAIELTPDVSKNNFEIRRAYYLLGRFLLKAGRREEAQKELARAKEVQGQSLETTRQKIGAMLGQIMPAAKNTVSKDLERLPLEGAGLSSPESATPESAKYQTTKDQLREILAQSYNNLGVIGVQRGQLPESMENFAAAARWKPDFPGLDRNWGIVCFRAKQFDQAVAPLSRQVAAHPDDQLARRMLGASYYLTRNYRQAVETLKPIEAALLGDAELAYFYGVSLVQLEDAQTATGLFSRLAENYPAAAEPRFYAAQGLMMTGDFERALKELRAIAQLAPELPNVHYNAGQSLIRLNRPEEAEAEFRKELRLNPADEKSKYHLAYLLLNRPPQVAEAVTLLKEVVRANPGYADARYQLGKALVEQGVLDEAIEHLEAAARADSDKDYIHYQLSIAYRRSSRVADADRELKRYRELKAANRNPNK